MDRPARPARQIAMTIDPSRAHRSASQAAVPRWWPLLATLFLALLFMPLPIGWMTQRWPALTEALQNTAHVPLFAGFALVLCRVLRSRWPDHPGRGLWLAGVLTIGLGGAVEFAQGLLGRDSAWIDLGNDLLGLIAALLHESARTAAGSGLRMRRRLLLGGMAAVIVVAVIPLAWTCAAYAARWVEAPVVWRADSLLFRVFSPSPRWAVPSFALAEVPQDWRSVHALEIDVENLSTSGLDIDIRTQDALRDRRQVDRYEESFRLRPRERRVLRIPVQRMRAAHSGRPMDLSRMRSLAILQATPGRQLFRVAEIRLRRTVD